MKAVLSTLGDKRSTVIALLTALILSLVPSSAGARHNVLALPHPCLARSHVLSFVKIGRSMVEKGHNFTLLLPVEDSNIVVDSAFDSANLITYPSLYTRSECLRFAEKMANAPPIAAVKIYVDIGLEFCEFILSHKPIWDALQSAAPADVFLGDSTWSCSSVIADILDSNRQKPLVRLLYQGTFAVDPFGEHFGLPSPASEAPGFGLAMWMLSFNETMSIGQRMVNLLFREVSRQLANVLILKPYSKIRAKAGLKISSEAEAMHSTASLIFVPVVWGVEPPRALPPNWKAIHPVLPSPPDALPKQIDSWIHSKCQDRNGLVVLSFGTQVTLTEKQSNKIFTALSSLADEFCFIWQLSTGSVRPPGLSEQDHILTLPWIPQNDLLGHSDTVAFVSHVGYGSLYEAAYHGVPLVCLPMFGDQDDNSARAVKGGWGIRLNKMTFTMEELSNAIRQAGAKGSPMRARASAVSKLVRARNGTDEVIEWMEYAATYGIEHLMPFRTMKSSYLAYYNLDAALILALIFLVLIYSVYAFVGRYLKRTQVDVDHTKIKPE